MKIDTKTKEQFIDMLKNSEDKPEAIYADVVQKILAQAEEDKAKPTDGWANYFGGKRK